MKYQNQTKRGFSSKKDASNFEIVLKLNNHLVEEGKKKHKFSFMANDFASFKKNELAYTSYAVYDQIIQKTIIPFFKDKNIEDITEIDCRYFREYVNQLSCSNKRKSRIIHLLKNIFLYGVDYYGLTNNPSAIIKTFNRKYEDAISRKRNAFNIWNDDDFSKFIKCVKNNKYKALYYTLYLTGMRLGEALALTWNDLQPFYLSITKSQTKKTEKGSYAIKLPKNVSSIRDVCINEALYNYLISVRKEQEQIAGFSSSWFIFWGEEPLSRTSIERIKNIAVAESGVRKIRIHDFRHSHASNLIGEGMDIVAVSKRLGHSTVDMTLKVYTHLFKKNEEKITTFLEKSSQNLLNFDEKETKSS